MSLKWKGLQGTMVDIYRNGLFLRTTANDGSDSNGRTFKGPATYVFKVCEARSIRCSDIATVLFNGGAPRPNVAPTAGFTSSCGDLSCSFTDASADWDGSVTAWSWDLGDNTGSSTLPSPSYTYSAGGSYPVTLTITDNSGAVATVIKSITVTAPPPSNTPPSAAFSASCTGLTCSFTDESTDEDGAVTDWSWDFGDGSSSTERNPSHDYAAEGEYQVTLTVTDDGKATGTVTQAVHPTAPAATVVNP
jgi:PKD repeat protein